MFSMRQDKFHRQPHRRHNKGATVVAWVVIVSLITITMAIALPTIVSTCPGWAASENLAEAQQNVRVLIDPINLHLSRIAGLASEGSAGPTMGCIESNDLGDTTCHCRINHSNDIEYGEAGSLTDKANLDSHPQFICSHGSGTFGPITEANMNRSINFDLRAKEQYRTVAMAHGMSEAG